MKVGILGTGFGYHHAKIYSRMSNFDSIIIFGRNEEKLKKIEKELKIKVTNNIDDIITNKDIDLVDVCLPNSLHRKYVIEALKSGKNVFCETPTALNLEDAAAIKQASEKYDKKVFIDMFIRFERSYEYIFEVIQNNTLGKLKALHVRRKTPHLWGDLGLDKITTNLMIHEFDFVTWLLGSPNKITASGVESKKGESHVSALLNYEDTAVEVQASSMMPGCHAFTVAYEAIFEDGTIEFIENGYADREEKSMRVFTNQGQTEIELANRDCYKEAIAHVLDCCQNDIPTRLSIDDALVSLKIALKMKDILLDKH